MKNKIMLSVLASTITTSIYAYDMKPVGFKAMSMGGTGVASTRGSLSGYYNPALLRFSDYTTEVSLNVGARVRESNLIDSMDQLSDLNFEDTIDMLSDNAENGNLQVTADIKNGKLITAEEDILLSSSELSSIASISNGSVVNIDGITFTKKDDDTLFYTQSGTSNNRNTIENLDTAIDIITNKIGTNNAFLVSVTPSFTAQISDAFAVGIYGDVDMGFRINIDNNYNKLITKQQNDSGSDLYYSYDPSTDIYAVTSDKSDYEKYSIEYANENDINYISVDSMVLAEVPISYAKMYEWNSGTWSFGLNLKPMTLTSYSYQASLGESSDDVDEDLEDYETTYKSTIGIDLGLAYQPVNSKMTFGFIAKNINSPTFKVDTTETNEDDYKLDAMLRAGVSVPFWNDNIEFAFDVDLTKNDTLIEDEQSQYIGAGLEFHPASWFSLRVGAMQDIAAEKFDDGTIMTGGIGFGAKWLQLDLSAMVSSKSGTYDGDDIPRYTALNVALVSKWGDGYNKKVAPIQKNSLDLEENKTVSPDEKQRIEENSEKAHEDLSSELES